jgi:stringent starvation protein B
MLTLKTRLVKSTMEFLTDRNLKIYIQVNWMALDKLKGSIDYIREGDSIILNCSPHSIKDFIFEENTIRFKARFLGKSVECVIPTASIMAVYDPHSGKGMQFAVVHDISEYLLECNQEEMDRVLEVSSQPVKGKPELKIVK